MPIRVRVPASISNLCHGFDCLGAALELANTISVSVAADPPDGANASEGLSAIIEQVRQDCARRWSCELPPLTASVTGDVPVSRGLGSSSTIYLGVAAACQRLADRPLDRQELVELGMGWEGHPDNVAAACLGGITVAGTTAAGPRLLRLEAPVGILAVLAIPTHEVHTREARRALPESLDRDAAVRGWQRSALIVAALASGDPEALRGLFEDGWHEACRASLNPGFLQARQAADAAGALGTFISGSGSAICSLVHADRAAPVVRALTDCYRTADLPAEILAVDFDHHGLALL